MKQNNERNENEIMETTRSGQPLRMAFLIPPDVLDVFYMLHKNSTVSQEHSAILTIPTQEHVASLVLSIPRTEAIAEGDKHSLPLIFSSGSPSL